MITNLSDLKLVMKEVDETLSDADITGKQRVTVINRNKTERKISRKDMMKEADLNQNGCVGMDLEYRLIQSKKAEKLSNPN